VTENGCRDPAGRDHFHRVSHRGWSGNVYYARRRLNVKLIKEAKVDDAVLGREAAAGAAAGDC